MKDLLFFKDLMTLLQQDSYYGNFDNLPGVLRKLGGQSVSLSDSGESMLHALAVHIMDLRGESEAFLDGTFIYAENVIALLKDKGLPAPAALCPAGSTTDNKGVIDETQYDQLFDTVCRNCGTVSDPLGLHYKTPIGRLIFRTFLATRQNLGIRTTAKYVFEHLPEYDTEKIVATVEEDYVVWNVDEENQKMISKHTIGKYIMKFDHELEILL